MNKIVFTMFVFMALHGGLMAQQNDSRVKKYINDTTGFVAYPDASLLDHIKPAQRYKRMEINTWASAYRPKGDKRPLCDYKNLCRYHNHTKSLTDSIVLTKPDPLKTFTACWCPSFYPWYISLQTKHNQLMSVGDTTTMKTFLGKTANRFNAYLWLKLHDQHEDIPVKTSSAVKYKKVKGGFLITYNSRTQNAPVTTANLTYFVGNDFQIVLISAKNVVVSKGMFI